MTSDYKYRVRFFFDYGAGGCLWADNDLAFQEFGVGPIDQVIADKTGRLSAEILRQIAELDIRHADYYNKDYPPDPSPWTQGECEEFNRRVDLLLNTLSRHLGSDFIIEDKQVRYSSGFQ